MRRRVILIAALVLGSTACRRGQPVVPEPEHPNSAPEEDAMTCPEAFDHELREGLAGPSSTTLPTTDSGASLELTANVVDHTAKPPTANIAWQTSPPSDVPGRDRVFMAQQVGDVLEIDGVRLKITGICEGRVTLDEAG